MRFKKLKILVAVFLIAFILVFGGIVFLGNNSEKDNVLITKTDDLDKSNILQSNIQETTVSNSTSVTNKTSTTTKTNSTSTSSTTTKTNSTTSTTTKIVVKRPTRAS